MSRISCNLCPKDFKNFRGLEIHTSRMHPGSTPQGVEKTEPSTPPQTPQKGRTLSYCPCCGLNLGLVRVTLSN